MIQMTKPKRTLIRIAIISFDISISIQSHKRQGEPTRVRNSHQEPARATESKPDPPSWFSKYPESVFARQTQAAGSGGEGGGSEKGVGEEGGAEDEGRT